MSAENVEPTRPVDEEDPTFVTDDKKNEDMEPPRSQSPEGLEKGKKEEPGKSAEEEEEERARKRQEQAVMFEKYIEESGLSLSFQIIFTELIQKQIPEDQVFAYTAMRLR